MTATVHNIKSIQGEQQDTDKGAGWVQATPQDVDSYVDKMVEGILACREGGHSFARLARSSSLVFTEVDNQGFFIRRLWCPSCECVEKVEKWESKGVGKRARFYKVGSHLAYHKHPQTGENYTLAPGMGHATRRQIAESIVHNLLGGVTPAQLRKKLAATS